MKNYAIKYLNKMVEVVIDRKLGTRHPKHEEIFYELNYGYISGTIAPDGEEVDAYVLDQVKPIDRFYGKVIAVVHRLDDEDDKLVVASKGKKYSDEQIMKLTNFQEKYFKSAIIRK